MTASYSDIIQHIRDVRAPMTKKTKRKNNKEGNHHVALKVSYISGFVDNHEIYDYVINNVRNITCVDRDILPNYNKIDEVSKYKRDRRNKAVVNKINNASQRFTQMDFGHVLLMMVCVRGVLEDAHVETWEYDNALNPVGHDTPFTTALAYTNDDYDKGFGYVFRRYHQEVIEHAMGRIKDINSFMFTMADNAVESNFSPSRQWYYEMTISCKSYHTTEDINTLLGDGFNQNDICITNISGKKITARVNNFKALKKMKIIGRNRFEGVASIHIRFGVDFMEDVVQDLYQEEQNGG